MGFGYDVSLMTVVCSESYFFIVDVKECCSNFS